MASDHHILGKVICIILPNTLQWSTWCNRFGASVCVRTI